jgi:hypothetical protein
MLTRKEFEDLWKEFAKAAPKCAIPNYDEYQQSENMFEDYLDIFRGVNTRNQRSNGNNKWYYEHPFFNGEKSKLDNRPCIKYIMIGEARPIAKNPMFNACGGDENNTYFYNITHVKQTNWLKEPFLAFYPAPWVKPSCPIDKIDILLQLASQGYILIDLFPFAINYTSTIRKKINRLGLTNYFYANYLDVKLSELCKLKCDNHDKKPIIAFSGPATTHHFLAHQIINGAIILNPCFDIFGQPNCFATIPVLAVPVVPAAVPVVPALIPPIPPSTTPWVPIANLLNGVYANSGFKKAPFYRCECWDASFVAGPRSLFIRNAFVLP